MSRPVSRGRAGRPVGLRLRAAVAVGLLAAAAFAVALVSPIETVSSDPALALLGAQAVIDHGTLRLDPYAGHPTLRYDLVRDYRVRHYAGASYPNSLGIPIVAVPAVWIANRLGWHMLDQSAEFALQNVLSALVCAWLLVLLYHVARVYLGVAASLAVAGAATFGSAIMSTGATALWNSNVALVFVGHALLHLLRRGAAGRSPNLVTLGLLLVGAFVVRPTAVVFGVACLVYLLRDRDRRVVAAAAVGLAAIVGMTVFAAVVPWPWMAGHYAPTRLRVQAPLAVGLYGVLLSPSRGLFVFTPCFALAAAGAVWYARRLWHERVTWLVAIWVALSAGLVAAAASMWWGGHSYGPRMLTDVVPAFVVLGALVWREVRRDGGGVTRRVAAGVFGVLAVVGVAIHTGQGLFNPAPRDWNSSPNIDADPTLAFDWAHPQFLATAGRLETRLDRFETRRARERRDRIGTLPLGEPIAHDAAEAIFVGWYPPEAELRWSRGQTASVTFRVDRVDATELYLAEIEAGARGRQEVAVEVNGTAVGRVAVEGLGPRRRLAAVSGRLLRANDLNTVTLVIPDPGPIGADSRRLGLSLRRLRLWPLPADGLRVRHTDDPFFVDGFSDTEASWRWTDGARARIMYPLAEGARAGARVLELRAGAYGTQRVDVRVNDHLLGRITVAGEAATVTLPLEGAPLRGDALNEVELRLPDAAPTPTDPRRLGLSLVWLRMVAGAP